MFNILGFKISRVLFEFFPAGNLFQLIINS